MGDVATVAAELRGTLPNTRFGVKGTVVQQWRERKGKRYGPYYCLMWCEGGRLRKRYLKRDEMDAVRASCEKRRAIERERRERGNKPYPGISEYEWKEARRYIRQMIRDAMRDNVSPQQLRKIRYRFSNCARSCIDNAEGPHRSYTFQSASY